MANNLNPISPPVQINFSNLISFKQVKEETKKNLIQACIIYGLTSLINKNWQKPIPFVVEAAICTSLMITAQTVYSIGCQFLGKEMTEDQIKNNQHPKFSQKMRAYSWKVIHYLSKPLYKIDKIYSKFFNVAQYRQSNTANSNSKASIIRQVFINHVKSTVGFSYFDKDRKKENDLSIYPEKVREIGFKVLDKLNLKTKHVDIMGNPKLMIILHICQFFEQLHKKKFFEQ